MKSAGIGMALFVALLTTRSFGQGTVLWDESVNGPISNSRFEPTSLGTFTLGTNSVLGTTDFQPSPTGGVVNPDYILLTVPSGSQISLLPFSSDRPVAVWLGDPGFGLESGSARCWSTGRCCSMRYHSCRRLVPPPPWPPVPRSRVWPDTGWRDDSSVTRQRWIITRWH